VYASSGDASVYIYKSAPPVPGPKGRGVQWSLTQTLQAEGGDVLERRALVDETFGSAVALDGENLFVGSSTRSYHFAREKGKWSQQAAFRTYDVQDISLVDSEVAIVSTEGDVHMLSTNTVWDCISISLEDHFGDNWDSAFLVVETPNGEKDSFAPSCITPNPYVFRYCPSSLSESGLYKVSIPDAVKAKYFWEIVWRVYVESTGEWIVGDHTTQMDFHFDSARKTFTPKGIRHALPANLTCTECPQHTPPHPKIRSLKGVSPSSSPAPTLPSDDSEDWSTVVLETSPGVSWFDSDHSGTSFYISDSGGKRLFASGTMCSGVNTQSCPQKLRDGTYVLRVGGALSHEADVSGQYWSFCGIEGTPQQELGFVVKAGECVGHTLFTRNHLCSEEYFVVSSIDVTLFVAGVEVTPTENDVNVLAAAIVKVLNVKSITASDITLVSSIPSHDGTQFTCRITTNLASAGYDAKDLSSVQTAVSNMQNTLNSHLVALWEGLVSNDANSRSFVGAGDVSVLGMELKGYESVEFTGTVVDEKTFQGAAAVPATSSVPLDTHVATEMATEYSITTGTVAGYVMIACSVMFVAYVVGKKVFSR